MMERDTLTLLTIGNIESKSIEELENRIRLLKSWMKFIQTEMEFVEYVMNNKKRKNNGN